MPRASGEAKRKKERKKKSKYRGSDRVHLSTKLVCLSRAWRSEQSTHITASPGYTHEYVRTYVECTAVGQKRPARWWWNYATHAVYARSPLAALHEERLVAGGEVRQQVQVQGGAQVVRVGHEHVLHTRRQELTDTTRAATKNGVALAAMEGGGGGGKRLLPQPFENAAGCLGLFLDTCTGSKYGIKQDNKAFFRLGGQDDVSIKLGRRACMCETRRPRPAADFKCFVLRPPGKAFPTTTFFN